MTTDNYRDAISGLSNDLAKCPLCGQAVRVVMCALVVHLAGGTFCRGSGRYPWAPKPKEIAVADQMYPEDVHVEGLVDRLTAVGAPTEPKEG